MSKLSAWLAKFRNEGHFSSLLAAFTSLVGIIAAVVFFFGGHVTSIHDAFDDRMTTELINKIAQRDLEVRNAVENSQHEIVELKRENDSLKQQLQSASNSRGSKQVYAKLDPSDRDLINKLKADDDQLQTRLSSLESALMNTPEKSLSTFALKQQVDELHEGRHADMEAVHGEMERLFTLTEWCLGLMFTIALGVFGLALTNLMKGEKVVTTLKPATTDH